MPATPIGNIDFYNSSNAKVGTMDFFNLHFPDGWPWMVYQNVIEPITAMGVPNTRMRIIRTDSERFRMTGHTQAATFDASVAAAVAVRAFKGFLGDLLFTSAGTNYTFADKCYIWAVKSTPAPCQLVSNNADSSSNGLIVTDFELQFTKIH